VKSIHSRFLADTWGSGITNRNSPTNFTYPYLLGSPHVVNLAMRASGPFYPAVCWHTMVGSVNPEVILLEFMLRASEGLMELATLIRAQYPGAIIIFLDLWYPRMVRVKDSHVPGKSTVSLLSYQRKLGFQSLHDTKFVHYLKTTKVEMFLNPRSDLSALQDEIAAAVHGYIWRLPYPKDNVTIGVHLASMLDIWSDDHKHMTETGHASVARGLQRLLRSIPRLPHITPQSPRTWEDSCSNWLLTGKSPHEILYGMEMKAFDIGSGKYALEVSSAGGALKVLNTFSQPVTMYLTYMVTGDNKYPDLTVIMPEGASINIVPRISQHDHISQTTKVGLVPPGVSIITFAPLEKDSEWPFRLVASALSHVDLEGKGFNALVQAELVGVNG